MLHAKALAVAVAYDVYLECSDGAMKEEWKTNKPVDFYTFREKLAKQMLSYTPQERKYPGDEKFRLATQQAKKKRKHHANVSSERNSSAGSVSTNSTCPTRESFVTNSKRLCGDLTLLCRHIQSVKPTDSSGRICVVCGKRCYSICTACGDPMHRLPTKKKVGDTVETPCFYHHHNTSIFGLSKRDAKNTGTRVKDWSFPNAQTIAKHRQDVLCLLQPRAIALPPTTPRLPPASAPAAAAVDTPQRGEEPPIDHSRVI